MTADRPVFGKFGKERNPNTEQRLYLRGRVAYHVWHIAQGKSRDVIDIDLTKPSAFVKELEDILRGSPIKEEKAAILGRFGQLNEDAQRTSVDNPAEKHNFEFFKKQVEASWYFARRSYGEQIDPFEYIEKTTGVKPEVIPAEVLVSLRDDVMIRLAQMDIPIASQESILGLRYENQLAPEVALSMLEQRTEFTIRAIKKFLRFNTDISYRVEPDNQNAYWWAYTGTDPKRIKDFLLRQNFHEGQQRIWTPGKVEELGSHEPEHLARMGRRKALIDSGKLNKVFGLTTVHGPESVVEEGLGQTLAFFVADPNSRNRKYPKTLFDTMSPEGQFWTKATILRNMTWANAHLMANSEGFSNEEIADYVKSFVPWEKDRDIAQQIKWRTESPLYQVYLYTYGKGAERFMDYASALNEQGRKTFLQNIYNKLYTLDQVEELFQRIHSNPSYRAPHSGGFVSYPNFSSQVNGSAGCA